MKYRVVSILKDNRPRFLIISDIEEIEILPSKYLKHLDQINASPNTVKSAAFALSYYYKFLQEQTIGLDEITLLSYSEQNKHFIDFLYWVKSGKHTEHNTQTSNKTCNMYLGAVFRYYQFLALEDVLPMLKVLRVKKVSYFDSMGVNHQNAVNSFKGFFKEEEPNLEEITSEEIQELINACTNDRDRLLIAMMAETGLRLGEILGIHYTEDIDFERRTVRVRYREFNSNLARAKNAEYRMALLSNTTFCMEGAIIALACIIFSVFAASPPAIADSSLSAVNIVWNYVAELIFNLLVLVGAIKAADRIVKEIMGL